jgi:very-short-patch-repair endonuclease
VARSERTAGDGTHFRRQAPIGPYIVDFFCPAAHLIIELDGGHHNECDTAQRDRDRQLWLQREGFRVVRFWNSDITGDLTSDITGDLTSVLERIYVELYGSREAEVETLKHFRRGKTVTPPRPLRGRPSPSREGKKEPARLGRYFGSRPFSFSASLTLSLKPPGITMSPGFWPGLQSPSHFASILVVESRKFAGPLSLCETVVTL